MSETKNVIDCILTKSFLFKTIDNVYKFTKLSITQQSNYFSNFIKNNIRMISNDSLYYYNDIDKLWTNIDKIQFDSRVYAKTKKEVSKRSFERIVRKSFQFTGSFKLPMCWKLSKLKIEKTLT